MCGKNVAVTRSGRLASHTDMTSNKLCRPRGYRDRSPIPTPDLDGWEEVGTRRRVRGGLFGYASPDGSLRWCLRADRPPHHPENCNCKLCWAVVKAKSIYNR